MMGIQIGIAEKWKSGFQMIVFCQYSSIPIFQHSGGQTLFHILTRKGTL